MWKFSLCPSENHLLQALYSTFFLFRQVREKACFQSFTDSFHPICEGCTLYSLYRSIIGSSSLQDETLYPASSQGMIPPLGKTAPHAGKIRKGLCHLPGSSLAASVRLIEENTSCCLFQKESYPAAKSRAASWGDTFRSPFQPKLSSASSHRWQTCSRGCPNPERPSTVTRKS